MNFDTRTDEEKAREKIFFKTIKGFACELIYLCGAESFNDVEETAKMLGTYMKSYNHQEKLISEGAAK